MPYSESLADRVRRIFAARRGVVEKKLFGGLGFMLRGNLCVCVWHSSLIARLGPEEAEKALRQPHVGPFDITGKPMSGWVVVLPEGIETDEELRAWVERAVAFVQGLPAK
jgi:hypothetical protein